MVVITSFTVVSFINFKCQFFVVDVTQVFDYVYECSIPSNRMNLAIFDICNAILFVIVVVAAFNMAWHLRFYTQKRKSDGNGSEAKKVRKINSFTTNRMLAYDPVSSG